MTVTSKSLFFMKHFTLLISFLFIFSGLSAQNDVVIANGTFESCGGLFIDTGGQGGPGYGNNEYFVCTICPDVEGDVVTVDFVTFQLDQTGNENTWDNIAIYDGDNTGEASLGFYTGDQLEGLFVTGTSQNTSGCLTFVFDSNSEGTGNFAGTITCGTPCDRPTASATMDAPESLRICVGDEITFDGTASFAAPGFTIVEYLWDFADGTTDNSGPIVSHVFDVAGEYIVELYLTDDNDCSSTNRVSLQLLVATFPSWDPFPGDQSLCLGQEFCAEVDPEEFQITWSGPDQSYENASNFVLEDVVGQCYQSEINVAGFGPGQTLNNVNDLLSIDINIEHSFMFDLVISLTCPNGNTVVLHQQMEQPVGADVGANGIDLGVANTEPWDYSWTPDATQGTFSQVGTGGAASLPEGEYNSLEPLDQLIGCELNGTWTLEICDLWGGDDGELYSFGLNFNPAIVPDVTEFTPDIGEYADSSYWTYPVGGPTPFDISADGNDFCILPDEEGSWDFTYTVFNNHGCTYDSTFLVTVEEAFQADAGEDFVFCGDGTTLSGGLDGIPTATCSADAGNYSFCYENNEIESFTYCPDLGGEDYTAMEVFFNAGSVENLWDEFFVYDGADMDAPLLDGPIYGDLTGMSWTATNPSGCLTIAVTPDGIFDCVGGNETQWNYDVSCTSGGPDYTYEWTPGTNLSDPNISNPVLSEVPVEITYTLTTYPLDRPECASFDEVTVTPAYTYTVDFLQPLCFEPTGEIYVDVDETTGVGPWVIDLIVGADTLESQSTVGGLVTFDELEPTEFTVSISDPTCTYLEEVNMTTPPVITLIPSPADITICLEGIATLSVAPDFDPGDMTYQWSNGGLTDEIEVSPDSDMVYSVTGFYGDGCSTEPIEVAVTVLPSLSLGLLAGGQICPGDSIAIGTTVVEGGIAPYTYVWTSDEGQTAAVSDLFVTPTETGNWCLAMNDQCETPEEVQCIEISVSDTVDPTFSVDTLGGCIPIIVGFEGNATNSELIQSAVWEFGDGAVSTSAHTVNHNYDNQGTYDVSYEIVTVDGCFFEHTESDLLTFYNWPIAGFNVDPQTAVLPNSEFEFINYTLGGDSYNWVFNEMDSTDEENPTYSFPGVAGAYPVTLYTENQWGCTDSIFRYVFIVDEFVMFVPNAFTPDQDGINDIWRFEGIDVDTEDFKVQIFDRWGEIVYISTDFLEGWDGSANRGEYYVPDGVYLYRIETRSLTTLERKELFGHIVIFR